MTAAVIWLIAGLVLVAAEVLSGEFVLLMLGAAAMAAAMAALLGAPILASALVFGGASVLLFAARPALRRRLDRGISQESMHTRALVGNEAVVVARVDSGGGRVKIAGDVWSARAIDDKVIEAGERVTVVDISGATAMVVARH